MVNYYQILGLDDFATSDEIKLTYRTLAKKYHPDISQGKEELFKKINQAYSVLSDENKKNEYDIKLENEKFALVYPSLVYNQELYQRDYKTNNKQTYTFRTKLYGVLFLVVFFFVSISIPIYLSYISSEKAYQEADFFMKNGKIFDALISYNRAINLFGKYSGDAAIQLSRIYFYKFKNNKQAIVFTKKGIEYSYDEASLGELKYLYGKILLEEGKIKEALDFLQDASQLSYHKDSISLQFGLINSYFFENYEKAIPYFDSILESNSSNLEALFGKAWCLQKLNLPKQSIKYYNKLVLLDSQNALTRFYRAHNNIILGDSLQACLDFQLAFKNGYQPAQIYLEKQCDGIIKID